MSDVGNPGTSLPGPYRVLARNYRPTRLSELIGQEALARTLAHAFESGRIAHAFLLSGIRGIGKTTTARIIARGLNCTGPDGGGGPTPEPCGVCPSCRDMTAERALDVIEMDAASQTGKADILELIDGIQFAPASSRFKVFILDEVHMLSEKAWNALLKTVEEPPPHVKFVFATTEIRKVPVTVLSRCQKFDLRRVEPAELKRHLRDIAEREKASVTDEALSLIASAAGGSVRDGLSLLDQAIALEPDGIDAGHVLAMLGLGDRSQIVALFETLVARRPADAIAMLAKLAGQGGEPGAILHDLLTLAHGASRLAVDAPAEDVELAFGRDLADRLAAIAKTASLPLLGRIWQMLLKGLEDVRNAPQAIMAAEMVLLRIACAPDLPPPAELARLFRGEQPALNEVLGQKSGGERSDGAPAAILPSENLSTRSGPPPSSNTSANPRQDATVRSIDPAAGSAPSPSRQPKSLAPRGDVEESFRTMVAALEAHGETTLAGWICGAVHPILYEPGRIEFRPASHLPGDVPARLTAALAEITGTRWLVAIGGATGLPTLAERDEALKLARIEALGEAAEIRPVMDIFPGATIIDIRPPSDRLEPSSDERSNERGGLSIRNPNQGF